MKKLNTKLDINQIAKRVADIATGQKVSGLKADNLKPKKKKSGIVKPS